MSFSLEGEIYSSLTQYHLQPGKIIQNQLLFLFSFGIVIITKTEKE